MGLKSQVEKKSTNCKQCIYHDLIKKRKERKREKEGNKIK